MLEEDKVDVFGERSEHEFGRVLLQDPLKEWKKN